MSADLTEVLQVKSLCTKVHSLAALPHISGYSVLFSYYNMFFLEGMKSSVFEDQHLILSMLMYSWDLDVLQWQLFKSSLEFQKQMFEQTLQIGNLFEVPSPSMSTQKHIPLLLVRDLIDGISAHQRQVRL